MASHGKIFCGLHLTFFRVAKTIHEILNLRNNIKQLMMQFFSFFAKVKNSVHYICEVKYLDNRFSRFLHSSINLQCKVTVLPKTIIDC